MVVREVGRGSRSTAAGGSLRRLALVVVTLLVAGAALPGLVRSADGEVLPAPVPRADCGPGARPETAAQGRVPQADYDSGRAARGYRCNTRQVAHEGRSGGFKVLRYRDARGHVCAFYDTTLLFPRDVLSNGATGIGTAVLDMSDPAHPARTAMLRTPAMVSPHETLLLNQRRGLLAGVLGTAATYPGVLDVYDVRTDCRHPRLLSSTPSGLLGHESGWTRDGRTFWSASTTGPSLVAVDLTDPRVPVPVFTQVGVNYHGIRLSPDGRTLYAANIGSPSPTGMTGGGLRTVDVGEVQDRVVGAQVHTLSDLTWPQLSIPQVAQPFTRDGHRYVLEVDEFVDLFSLQAVSDLRGSPVGAARIIDVDDPTDPVVVSDIRLEVHQPAARQGEEYDDPGASFPAQGYAAHYCSVPTPRDPQLVACSMILSGLRVFDIRDLEHPREVAYFNRPLMPGRKASVPEAVGSYAMSQPAWDPAHRSIWYSDANTGFHVVRLTNGVGRLLP